MSNIMESLILAQNERWRRVLSMQVERQEEACFLLERRTGEKRVGDLPLGWG